MLIRRAQPADLVSVEQCARSAYQKYIERIGREPAPMVADFSSAIAAGQVLVLLHNTVLIAFAVCYIIGDCMQLDNIAVHPVHQGGGHGRYLLEHIHVLARHNGLRAVTLYTNEKMVENLDWYIKCGYLETARQAEDGFNRVYFEKPV